MKVIVTGGAGFIGSNLTGLLLEKGHKVLVIDDFSVGKKENLPVSKNLTVMKEDIRNKKAMKKIVKNADIVYHLAVQCVRKSIRDPWLVHDVNSTGTLSVLNAGYINKIKKFVYISSSEVYGHINTFPVKETDTPYPTTIYGASKLAGENYTLAYFRTYGYPAVVVRPFNTYGDNEHFEGPYGEVIPRFVVRALNNLPLEIFGKGDQTRDFTFVTDTARGIYEVAQYGRLGEIYNIARGEEVSIKNLAKIIIKSLGVSVTIKHLPPRPGDLIRLLASTEKSKKELRFKAEIDIDAGVNKYIKWFNKNYPNPKKALKYYQSKNW